VEGRKSIDFGVQDYKTMENVNGIIFCAVGSLTLLIKANYKMA